MQSKQTVLLLRAMRCLDGQLRRLPEMLSIVQTTNTDMKKRLLNSFQRNQSLSSAIL
nr:MAG TPA: hypothetical protein [Caudoviricetes sp.]